ncbi:MAG: SDR family oxidoreductase [Bacteroidales bacterium]|nr:SDR family oxidoreductase [Bacteroidales bacterium]
MDLKLKDKHFIVTGATSGLGKGVATALLREGAGVIAVGRDEKKLSALHSAFPERVIPCKADVFVPGSIEIIGKAAQGIRPDGLLVNAAGPPAGSFLETNLEAWDKSYRELLRWKIEFVKTFLPSMLEVKYGRILFIESSSVKQPLENLVLSNSLRLAVVGFVKTLSQEIASSGVTLNILAPGFHDTPAVERLFVKRASSENISLEEARKRFESEIKMGRFGNRDDFGSLAAWLLSPFSGYITGQTISVDGGFIKGTMG